MKKKIILITTLATSLLLVGGVATFGFTNAGTYLLAKEGDNHDHTIYFYGEDVFLNEYPGDWGDRIIGFSKEDAIVVSDDEKYDIRTIDYDPVTYWGSYACTGSESNLKWNVNNNIVVIESSNYDIIQFCFELDARSNVDRDKSVLVYYYGEDEDTKYTSKIKYHGEDPDAGKVYYGFQFDNYSDFGKKITIAHAKLVFGC